MVLNTLNLMFSLTRVFQCYELLFEVYRVQQRLAGGEINFFSRPAPT